MPRKPWLGFAPALAAFPPEPPVVAHLQSGKFLLMLDDANENPVNLEGLRAQHTASPTPTLGCTVILHGDCSSLVTLWAFLFVCFLNRNLSLLVLLGSCAGNHHPGSHAPDFSLHF